MFKRTFFFLAWVAFGRAIAKLQNKAFLKAAEKTLITTDTEVSLNPGKLTGICRNE